MSNPNQKSGNTKGRTGKRKVTQKDRHIHVIARQEARKVISKKIESKNADLYNTAFNIDYNGSFHSVAAALNRGSAGNQFIGDSIMPTHLRVKWAIIGADTFNVLRVIVFQNKAGGIPVAGTLLQVSASVITPLSAYNRDYSDTYKVLFDEFYGTVGYPSAASPTNTSQITGDIRIPAKKLHKLDFNSVGSVTLGDIYIVFLSDSSVVTPPIGQFYARLYFKDA